MFDLISEADRLDRRIRELPRGSISRKTINGKVRHYRQWYEDGRTKGVYIRDQDLERVEREIEERKRCQEELAEVRSKIEGMKASLSDGGLYNRVMTGEDLIRWACRTEGWEARDSLRDLVTFLGSDDDRVCILYGLRRTGKTTMIRQAIAAMSPEDRWASAYVSVDGKGSMAKLCHDIRVLRAQGIRFLFIDEVTLLEDFVSGSSVFSDIYTAFGRMRIVLTGTDSLAFRFAGADRLYDRTFTIHTTYIPFREHCRLVLNHDSDVYIRFGGMLCSGQFLLEDGEVEPDGLADIGSMEDYLNRSVVLNIQNSLRYAEYGSYMTAFSEIYKAGELTNVINRVVEDINHRFLLDVIDSDYRSANLESAMANLDAAGEGLLSSADIDEITERLKGSLDIVDACERKADVTQGQLDLIRRYLRDLDVVGSYVLLDADSGSRVEMPLIVQPGLKYAQVSALVDSILGDGTVRDAPPVRRERVIKTVMGTVMGRMLEEIVILDTQRAVGRDYEVFKLRCGAREADMVIRHIPSDRCVLIEVKHGSSRNPRQYRHLVSEEVSGYAEREFGRVVGRYVLYRGDDADQDGVGYRNVERYLEGLPLSAYELFRQERFGCIRL